MNTAPCPTCGYPSWNAALNPGQSCLPCERRAARSTPSARPSSTPAPSNAEEAS